MSKTTKSIFLIHGAKGNGFGDIDCGMVSATTKEEGIDLIYRELIEQFAENREEKYLPDWCPSKDDIANAVDGYGLFCVPIDMSGADYDYCWRMCEVKLNESGDLELV